MDLQALIVFVGGFAFVAIAGYLVTVFGAKEQVRPSPPPASTSS